MPDITHTTLRQIITSTSFTDRGTRQEDLYVGMCDICVDSVYADNPSIAFCCSGRNQG